MAPGLHVGLFALALLSAPMPAWALVYWADAVEGWVVDSATGKPVEGAIVVAHWQLKGGWEGGVAVGQMQIYETVTDAAGRYFIPGWGPRFALRGQPGNEWPGIFVFKPGYRHLALSNERRGRATGSDSNGKTLRLSPFTGTLPDYARDLRSLNASLWIVGRDSGEPCGWESYPRMLRALVELDERLRAAGIAELSVASRLEANRQQLADSGCAPLAEVLKK